MGQEQSTTTINDIESSHNLVKTLRKTRSGNIVESTQCADNDNLPQEQPPVKLTRVTRDSPSQTDFPEDFSNDVALGQYLETKLGSDLTELRVREGGADQLVHYHHHHQLASPEIVIVEYEQEEII